MPEKEHFWTAKLDWLNILRKLKLDSINQIQEFKREKAIKKITKTYSIDTLLNLEPEELDRIVVTELKELMRKELTLNARRKERIKKEMQNRFVPFKNGGIIKIDPNDFKDLDLDGKNPEEILKKIAKKFLKDDEDESDDETKNYKEDNTGYYI